MCKPGRNTKTAREKLPYGWLAASIRPPACVGLQKYRIPAGILHPLDGMNTRNLSSDGHNMPLCTSQKPQLRPERTDLEKAANALLICFLIQPTAALDEQIWAAAEKSDVQRMKHHARITGKQGLYRKNSAEGQTFSSRSSSLYAKGVGLSRGKTGRILGKYPIYDTANPGIEARRRNVHMPSRSLSAVWARNSELVGLSPTEEARRPSAAR